jgi:hypothetical protein
VRKGLFKKKTRSSASTCEYLIGDDTCSAVKEGDLDALRAKVCLNEVKDKCCYLCDAREKCEIGCDLPVIEKRRKPRNEQQVNNRTIFQAYFETGCGDCVHYLKPECPRDYSRDTELWRRQDPCEKFEPSEKLARPLGRNGSSLFRR